MSRLEKHSIYFNSILMGLYMFYIGIMFHEYIYIDSIWTRIFSLAGLALLFWGGIKVKKSIDGCDKQIKGVCYILFTLCLCHIIIGLPFCKEPIGLPLFSLQYLWLFVIPYAFVISVKPQDVRFLIRWSMLYVLTSLVFSLYFFNDFFYGAEDILSSMIGWESYIVNRPQEPALLLYPITAFAILFPHFSKHWQASIILAVIFAIGAGLMAGRRSAIAILILLLLMPIVVIHFRFKAILGVILIIVCILSFCEISYIKIETVFEDIFPVLADRIDSDTRSGVEEDFYKDMNSFSDWVFGRGMNGTYRCLSNTLLGKLHRNVIETGYLNIILHGGLVLLIPYLCLLFYASYKGFFYSKSLFLKGCAIYVFMHILMLYPEGTPRLTLDYFILFVFIRMCVSKEWRNKSTEEIKKSVL